MLTKKYGFLIISILLAGCVTKNQTPRSAGDQLYERCTSLKQDIIMDSVNAGTPNQFGNNPITQAVLYKKYRKYDCDAVLANEKRGR